MTRTEMEGRRLKAVKDLPRLTVHALGKKYGVSAMTASRWRRLLRTGGTDALKEHKAPGRPSRLTQAQLLQVKHIYLKSPCTHAALAAIIEAEFGVHYDQDHVGRMIHKFGVPTHSYHRVTPASPTPQSQ